LGLVRPDRTLHYMDLGEPKVGFNPLAIKASPGVRAAVFLQALIDASPAGAIQAASDSFLRQAVAAVCTVEPQPTLSHVYRMLDFGDSPYRRSVVRRLVRIPGADFARRYWRRDFPALILDRGYAAQALNPSVSKMLAEGRAAGLEAVFGWQYSDQIPGEVTRSGVRSLLQSISLFRMREMEDARSLAGLAMEVYSDRIGVDQDEQERLRF